MKRFCENNICVEGNKIKGFISGLKTNIDYDPTIILPDLRCIQLIIPHEVSEDFIFDDFDYAYEYVFDIKIKIKTNEREQYSKLVNMILVLIKESYEKKAILDIKEIDFLKDFFDIKYNLTPSVKYGLLGDELSVKYYHFSIKRAITIKPSNIHNFFYECSSISDLIFSILHFLAINEYKFAKCIHCGRYFATRSYKQKYCKRNSPYERYSHLSCEQAIRNISQEFKRRYNRIYLKFNPTNNTSYNEEAEIFKENYCKFKKEFLSNSVPQKCEEGFELLKEWEQKAKEANKNNLYI